MGMIIIHNVNRMEIHCSNMRQIVLISTPAMHVCKAPLEGVDADMTTRRLEVVAEVAISEVEWSIRMLETAHYLLAHETLMRVDNRMLVSNNRHDPRMFST